MSWEDYTDYLTSHTICSSSAILSGDTGGLVAGNNFTVINPFSPSNTERVLDLQI